MAALAVAVGIACSASKSAFAQPGQLEEIIVTAEKRTNTEATTAISIEVLTDDFIASNQIKDIIDLQNAVPALQFYQNGSYVQANIRGVGNPSTGGPSEQVGVPVFFDGATQGEEMGIASGFFDVAGIEVLRGPQATFVGQGAEGGAILINAARPNFDGLSGFIEGSAGDYNTRKVMGAVNLPVSDKLAARLAFMSETRDSFYTNAAGQGSAGAGEQWVPGDQQDQNFRVSLLWEPTESFSLWTKYENSELHTYGIPNQPNPRPYYGFWDNDNNLATPPLRVRTYAPNYQGPAPGTGTIVNGVQYGGTPGPGGAIYDPLDPRVLANPQTQERNMKVDRVSVEANWQLPSGITFRSLSSNIEMNRLQVEGGNSLVYQSLLAFQLGPGMQTWSQEFNLISPEGQRVEWLLGLYENNRHTELHLNIPLPAPCGWAYNSSWTPCPTQFVPAINRLEWFSFDDVIHKAIYGQLNFHLSDALELTLEARQNQDDNTQKRATFFLFGPASVAPAPGLVQCTGYVENQPYYCPPPGYPNPNGPAASILDWKGDIPTYKIGLNWEPADGHFLYAFVARGYKAGQSTLAADPDIVEEVVDDIEIGWKGTLRPNLYAEVGLYSMDYTDMQLNGFLRSAQESKFRVTNIGDSKIEGLEASIRAVFGGFGVNASFNYTDSALGAITTANQNALNSVLAPPGIGQPYPGDSSLGCTPAGATVGSCFDFTDYVLQVNGSENPFSPKITYFMSFDYAFNLKGGGTLTPSLSFNHADSTYTNTLQERDNEYYRTEDRDIANFSLNYDKEDWNVQFFVNNLSDELFIEGSDGGSVLYGDPRTVGFRARREF